MDLSKNRKVRNTIAAVLMVLFLFANIYAVRQLMRYGTELFFYDKLNVAFQTGGVTGFNAELERIILQDKMPREVALAKAFKKDLAKIKEPQDYVQVMVADRSDKVVLFRNLRNIAFFLILGILLLRAILFRIGRARR